MKKYDKYGFAPVGAASSIKFLVNRVIWRLSKTLGGGEPGFFWFEKPFRLDDVFYSMANGYYFRASDRIDFNFMGGRHESFQDEYLRGVLREGAVFMDVGAHLGRFTLLGSRLVGEKGMVVALEPDREVYNRLTENIGLNGLRNIVPLPVAASNRNELALFRVSSTSGWSSLTDMHIDTMKEEVPVPAFRLDSIAETLNIGRVDLLKIDVEGAEGEVLEGAVDILESFTPSMLVEVHGEKPWSKCSAILEEHGYETNVIHLDITSSEPHFHVFAHSESGGERLDLHTVSADHEEIEI